MVMQGIQVAGLLKQLLECSVYVSPKDHGLSHEELMEAGGRLGLKRGEIADALKWLGRDVTESYETRRWTLDEHGIETDFFQRTEPDYRNPKAFEFVRTYLLDLAREVMLARAQAPRGTIVAAGMQRGIPENDLEIAITAQLINKLAETRNAGIGLTQIDPQPF